MHWLWRIPLALVAAALLGAAGLWLATRGDYPVAATVGDDPALPAIDALGLRLHGRVLGPQGAPLIIVLHGGPGGDHRSLLPLDALADEGWRILFYDQRGAGLSQRVEIEALTLQGHLDELSALADTFSPDAPVILIGHSWGAMLASAWLGRRPDRTAAAVLIEPGFLSARGADAFLARMRAAMTTPAMGWTALRSGFEASHVSGPDASAADDYLFARMVEAFANAPGVPYHCPGTAYDSPAWRFGASAGSAVLAQASRADLDSLGAVDAFAGPVLLVAGACDSWLGADLQRQHAAGFRNATLVVIPDAGHDVIDDRPTESLAAIRTFLATLQEPAAP